MLKRLGWTAIGVLFLAVTVGACSRLHGTYAEYVRHPATGAYLTVVTTSAAWGTDASVIYAGRRNGALARLRFAGPPHLDVRGECFSIGSDGAAWVIEGDDVRERRPSDAAFPYRVSREASVWVRSGGTALLERC